MARQLPMKKARKSVRPQQRNKPDLKLVTAQMEPQRKRWTHLDLKSFRSKTENQSLAVDYWMQGSNLVLEGCAGTGKTFLATYLALRAVFDEGSEQEKVVVIRSAVQAVNQGFLPGTAEEKMAVYELPYQQSFAAVLDRPTSYKHLKDANKVEFDSTSFLRGINLDRCVIILEEVQNLTFHEISTVITRMGRHSRLIITGDTQQADLKTGTGFPVFKRVAQRMKGFASVVFNAEDIVRCEFVKQWIIATMDLKIDQSRC